LSSETVSPVFTLSSKASFAIGRNVRALSVTSRALVCGSTPATATVGSAICASVPRLAWHVDTEIEVISQALLLVWSELRTIYTLLVQRAPTTLGQRRAARAVFALGLANARQFHLFCKGWRSCWRSYWRSCWCSCWCTCWRRCWALGHNEGGTWHQCLHGGRQLHLLNSYQLGLKVPQFLLLIATASHTEKRALCNEEAAKSEEASALKRHDTETDTPATRLSS